MKLSVKQILDQQYPLPLSTGAAKSCTEYLLWLGYQPAHIDRRGVYYWEVGQVLEGIQGWLQSRVMDFVEL